MTKHQQELFRKNLKINSFKSDFETTSRIIDVLWKLNDESSKHFSELNLLLSINSIEENKKMKKGLKTVSKNLLEMSKKIYEYADDSTIIEEDL